MAEPVRFVTALVPEELVRVIAESDPWTLDRIVDLMRELRAVDAEAVHLRKGILFRQLVVVPYGRMQFVDKPRVDPMAVIRLIQGQPKHYRMDGPDKVRITLELPEPADRLKAARGLLIALSPG